MTYYALVYHRVRGELLAKPERFADCDRRAALQRRFALEEIWRDDPDVEIVVIGSESEAQVRHTHGRYFKSFSELLSSQAAAPAP